MLAEAGPSSAKIANACKIRPRTNAAGAESDDGRSWPKMAKVGPQKAQIGQIWPKSGRISAADTTLRQLLNTSLWQLRCSPGLPGRLLGTCGEQLAGSLKYLYSACHNRPLQGRRHHDPGGAHCQNKIELPTPPKNPTIVRARRVRLRMRADQLLWNGGRRRRRQNT